MFITAVGSLKRHKTFDRQVHFTEIVSEKKVMSVSYTENLKSCTVNVRNKINHRDCVTGPCISGYRYRGKGLLGGGGDCKQ